MTEKLKPCPFCGGRTVQREADVEDGTGRKLIWFECEDCHASSSEFYKDAFGTANLELATQFWNKRQVYVKCYELKECPFCGSRACYFEVLGKDEDERVETHLMYRAACSPCRAKTAWYPASDDAIAAWNRRSKAD